MGHPDDDAAAEWQKARRQVRGGGSLGQIVPGKPFLVATGIGVAGVLTACGVVQLAASMSESLSVYWIFAGAVLPAVGLTIGLAVADRVVVGVRHNLRLKLTAVSLLLGSFGMYLAFTVLVRTWYADQIAPENRGFTHLVLHPDEMPQLLSTTRTGDRESQGRAGYGLYFLLGALACPFFFWGLTKPPPGQ